MKSRFFLLLFAGNFAWLSLPALGGLAFDDTVGPWLVLLVGILLVTLIALELALAALALLVTVVVKVSLALPLAIFHCRDFATVAHA